MIEIRSGEPEREERTGSDAMCAPVGDQSPIIDETLLEDPGEPRCAECGGVISQTDIVCPHCGVSLVAG